MNRAKRLPEHIFRRVLYSLAALIFSIGVAALVGMFAYRIARRLALSQPLRQSFSPVLQLKTGAPPALPEVPTAPVPATTAILAEPTLAPWDEAGRVTILILGLDYRDWQSGSEHPRSDTMILLTLDPLSRTAGMLSIPRDLWVVIPGFNHGKINTAYYLGEAYHLPGGGPGLAAATVEQLLGVPVNYYAQIDFGAFVSFIDLIGGVKINVTEPITIDLLGSGAATKKRLRPGIQVLPGEWALAYARARNSEGGDFDRARRQQQVILAIRDRILSLDQLPTLITKADDLYRELASGIRTNLRLEQAIKLALLASQVREGDIYQGVIDERHVLFGRSPDNLAILIPLIDKIHVLRDDIFASTTALSPLTPGNAQERMMAEHAAISIWNASGEPGLGERTAQFLMGLGVIVREAEDVAERAPSTKLVDTKGRPFTSRYLMDLIGISPNKFEYQPDPAAQSDLTLILGVDWARSHPFP